MTLIYSIYNFTHCLHFLCSFSNSKIKTSADTMLHHYCLLAPKIEKGYFHVTKKEFLILTFRHFLPLEYFSPSLLDIFIFPVHITSTFLSLHLALPYHQFLLLWVAIFICLYFFNSCFISLYLFYSQQLYYKFIFFNITIKAWSLCKVRRSTLRIWKLYRTWLWWRSVSESA